MARIQLDIALFALDWHEVSGTQQPRCSNQSKNSPRSPSGQPLSECKPQVVWETFLYAKIFHGLGFANKRNLVCDIHAPPEREPLGLITTRDSTSVVIRLVSGPLFLSYSRVKGEVRIRRFWFEGNSKLLGSPRHSYSSLGL